ncbi:hypothetical protein ACLOJK_030043 [Asimina triloba]
MILAGEEKFNIYGFSGSNKVLGKVSMPLILFAMFPMELVCAGRSGICGSCKGSQSAEVEGNIMSVSRLATFLLERSLREPPLEVEDP